MSEITDYLSGYLNELANYMDRLNGNKLSKRDQKLFLEMSNEYYDMFLKAESIQAAVPESLLQEMANFNDNIISQAADSKDQANQYYGNILKYANPYISEVKRTELMIGVFQIDAEISNLQNEKLQMLQELVDQEMNLHGEISQVTKEIVDVQGCEIVNGNVRVIMEWEKQEKAENIENNIDKEPNKIKLQLPYMTRETFRTVTEAIKGMGARYDSINKWYVEAGTGKDKVDSINEYLAQHDEGIYLKLPPASPKKFKQITEKIKHDGARYNPTKKAWYITEKEDRSKFVDYLPAEKSSVHEKLNQYKKSAEGQSTDNRALESRRKESPELV